MTKNSFKKLFTISKVIEEINKKNKSSNKITSHTVRYWEKRFNQLKPTLLNGNRRYYSEKDIDLLNLILFLLKDQKLTIEGANKILKKNIYSLDDFHSSSIKANIFKENIINKSLKLLDKIEKIKNGKKNTR